MKIYLGNSGTSSRFLLALTALFPKNSTITFTADERLNMRPMKNLINVLVGQSLIEVTHLEEGKIYPMVVKSLGNRKIIKDLEIDCSETSQFASSLILIAPFLGEDEVSITLNGDLVSESYILTSVEILKQFGAKVSYDKQNKVIFWKSLGYNYKESDYTIEADISTAAFDVAYSAIFGQPIILKNLSLNCLQGEIELINLLQKYFEGFICEEVEDGLYIKGLDLYSKNSTYISNIEEINLLGASDWFIALSTILALKLPAGTVTKIRGWANQRIKEWNRLEKVVEILNSFHILSYELKDGIAIISSEIFHEDNNGNKTLKMTDKLIKVHTYDDHRLAMAFAIMGSVMASKNKIVIENARTVGKTFPEFWTHIHK